MFIKSLKIKLIALLTFAVTLSSCQDNVPTDNLIPANKAEVYEQSVLIFSKTAGFRHDSIAVGVKALEELALENKLSTTSTENSSIFTDKQLKQFSAIIFLNTTGDILNEPQQLALERYIQAGGGFVGIHAATDTEYDWHWFGRMIGGRFKNHPKIQKATLNVVSDNAMVKGLLARFEFEDEWYNFTSLSDRRHDLITLDEASYEGGDNGINHPISWYHNFDGGRVFYTGLGHRTESYSDPLFLQSIKQGLAYAIGNNVTLNYKKSRPEPNLFVKNVLVDGLNQPVSLDITKNGDKILWIEQKGKIHWFDLNTKKQSYGGVIPVYSDKDAGGFGLLAVALHPHFDANNFVYFMFNTKNKKAKNNVIQRISRFTFDKGVIDLNSEVVMIDVPSENTCCHNGSNMEFDEQGHLYIALGDNTNPFSSKDERPDEAIDDALQTIGDTQNLRGKVLRIIPTYDGKYNIPVGNLFEDNAQGKPEIYVMGARKPSSLAYDNVTETLYFGDVGPNNHTFNAKRGAKGYDEVNRVRVAGNVGWPLFIGFNQPYRYFDYVKNGVAESNTPEKSLNKPLRNTDYINLPPAQEPIVAYPYEHSVLFPELGAGSRHTLVAGVYRSPITPNTEINAYPSYYDGGLFISDFMRRWIKVISFDSSGRVLKIEDFAPDANLSAPIALKFSVNGELFVLEYGDQLHSPKSDARLSQIQYLGEGNRSPVAHITIEKTQGAKPFTINANANTSTDPDNDEITYRWHLKTLSDETQRPTLTIDTNDKIFFGAELTTQIKNNGKYALILEATDANGDVTHTQQLIEVGNSPPNVEVTLATNQSFVWPNGVNYQIDVNDVEDGNLEQGIDSKDVYVSLKKINSVNPSTAFDHTKSELYIKGGKAIKENNCLGCHQLTQKSVGPSFRSIAEKYQNTASASKYIGNVIDKGSSGKWGENKMPAHDFLKKDVQQSIAAYILAQLTPTPSLPLSGVIKPEKGVLKYELSAVYSDKGSSEFESIKKVKTVSLVPSVLHIANFITHQGEASGVSKEQGYIPKAKLLNHQSSISIGRYDLTSVKAFTVTQYFAANLNTEAELEIRIGSKKGEVIAKGNFTDYARIKKIEIDELQQATFEITKPINRYESLFLVVSQPENPDVPAFRLGTVEFVAQ